MPIHLPPVSRRDFLRRALLAGAGLALAPQLGAATRQRDPDSWALLADTHIAADANFRSRKVNMADNLRNVANQLLTEAQRPAGVFVIGDCAYSKGEKGDYRTFLELVEPVRAGQMPLHLALGNHDERANALEAIAEKDSPKSAVADKHVAVVRGERANWFMLDSLEKTLQTPGLLGEAQLDWLAKSLDANKRKPALVVVHHNPGTEANIAGLKDTAALLDVIRPRKQVKAWIYGHTHQWHHTRDESGIHLVNLPPVAYVFQEGEPSGWVHATLRKDGVKLELHCVDPTHRRKGEVVDLKWRS